MFFFDIHRTHSKSLDLQNSESTFGQVSTNTYLKIFMLPDQCDKMDEWFFICSSSSSIHPLDSIAGLLDLSLLYHLWISATFLLFTWYITLLLFGIFVTEVCAMIKVSFVYRLSPV